jgi:hypothetical protein
MKFLKVLSVIFVIAMLSSLFVSCAGVKVEYSIKGCFEKKVEVNNSGDDADAGAETQVRHKVKAHLKIVDYSERILYATDVDDPFEYDSAYFEPTVVKFIQNYADMNEKKISCKFADNGLLSSIGITKKGVTKNYDAQTEIVSQYDGSTQKTYWVCYINGEMVSSMKETLIKDGDVVELYYVYPDWDKESILPDEPVEDITPEDTPAE